ncbi:hypothetical protein VRRI112168_02720 [Vreelandella rituensis]|uniref:Uncharacterized protein n=1 Tax=Vreelandella rituensis TaxID=2282306 RepID=A0A368UAV3_9GAMM|nr:hypothetical protein [Halomonas rituensis]RCV93657.1 hypothetical protein DU506_00440 [Halomonas rituensis]
MITADSLKIGIRQRIRDYIAARDQYAQSVKTLCGLGLDRSGRDRFNLFAGEDVFQIVACYMDELCQMLNAEFAKGTPARIETALLLGNALRGREALHQGAWAADFLNPSKPFDPLKQQAYADTILAYVERIDFEAIAAGINAQLPALEGKGLAQIARELSLSFRFRAMAMGSYQTPLVQFKAGRVITKGGTFSGGQDNWEQFETLRAGIERVAKDGDIALGSGLGDLSSAIEDLSWGDAIASRSTFGKRDALEIRCFKDKFEYHWSRDAFDALQAFICLHGEPEVADVMMSVAALDTAA